jgi:hypothetical protein
MPKYEADASVYTSGHGRGLVGRSHAHPNHQAMAWATPEKSGDAKALDEGSLANGVQGVFS